MNGFPLQIEKQYVRYVERLLNQVDREILTQLKKSVDLTDYRSDSPLAYNDNLDSFMRWLSEYVSGFRKSEVFKKLEQTTKNTIKSVNNFHRNFTRSKIKQQIKEAKKIENFLRPNAFFATFEVPRPDSALIEGIVDKNVALISEQFDIYKDTIQASISNKIRSGITRAELIKELQKETGVTRSKAKFWASDQLGKASSALSLENQTAAGFEEFIWETQRDGRVRDDHAVLQGKKFRYDRPPVIDGRQILPGEDYNCRCFQNPVTPGTPENPPDQRLKDLKTIYARKAAMAGGS